LLVALVTLMVAHLLTVALVLTDAIRVVAWPRLLHSLWRRS